MQSIDCVRAAVYNYGDMLYRLCFVMLRNTADAEDAVQETFIAHTTKSQKLHCFRVRIYRNYGR